MVEVKQLTTKRRRLPVARMGGITRSFRRKGHGLWPAMRPLTASVTGERSAANRRQAPSLIKEEAWTATKLSPHEWAEAAADAGGGGAADYHELRARLYV